MLPIFISVAVVAAAVADATMAVNEMIGAHNAARAQISLGPVTWAPELETSATASVAKCPVTHDLASASTENLAWGWPTLTTAAAVQNWLDEKKAYQPATQSCAAGQVCGHYMNMIKFDRIGCAMRSCPNMFGQALADTYACHYATTPGGAAAAPAATPSPTTTATAAPTTMPTAAPTTVATAAPMTMPTAAPTTMATAAPVAPLPPSPEAKAVAAANTNMTMTPPPVVAVTSPLMTWPSEISNSSRPSSSSNGGVADHECATGRQPSPVFIVGNAGPGQQPSAVEQPMPATRRAHFYQTRSSPARYSHRHSRPDPLRQPWSRPDSAVLAK